MILNPHFVLNRLGRLNARIAARLFVTYEILRSRLFSKRRLKIIFSDHQDLKQAIKQGFEFTQHKISFKEFSPGNIKSYDLVVPLNIPDLKYLDEVRNLIKDNPIPIPSIESILLCDDKYLMNQFLIAKGFGRFIPKMFSPIYPYILKKRIDEWGKNSHIISNTEQEQNFSDIILHQEYFSQELIIGPCEYATHIFIKNQKIVCAINIKYVFETEMPIKGKDKPVYTQICRCPYLDIFTSILNCIGFEGLCCLNYKVHGHQPMILEINPRFGGSLSPYFFSFIRHIG